jgi:DNA-directed RNA polymerase subunit RPC12/RpoP
LRNTKDRFREIKLRYDDRCVDCGREVSRGDWVVWDEIARKVYCARCGEHLPVQGELLLKRERE